MTTKNNTTEKCYIEVTALANELDKRIQKLTKDEANATTSTTRYKYKVQKQALNSLWDWLLYVPWEVKNAEYKELR